MLFVALLGIGALAMVENIETQIRRDREEELIHRGVQYSRAVQHYFKKFGRYPSRIEELENTNNIRFLRKRYKDPITGKDFKPLRMTDVQISFPAATGAGPTPTGLNTQGPGANTPVAIAGLQNPPAVQFPAPNQSDTPLADQSADGGNSAPGTNTQPSPPQAGPATGSNQPTSQTFGGGPIVGVASVSKDKTIREFNKKDHYNQWQFIYDPTSDRGGLLMTPNQPPLRGAVGVNPQNGAPGAPGPNQGFSIGQQPGPGSTPMQPNPMPPDQ